VKLRVSTKHDEAEPGDLVTIYYQEPHVVGESTKFRSTWSVPFCVVKRLDNGVNYEVTFQSLSNPEKKRVVHVSRLRIFQPWHRYGQAKPGCHIDLSTNFPGYVPSANEPKFLYSNEDYEIEAILDQYKEGKGKDKRTWYLVQWKGYNASENSWVLSTKVYAIDLVSAWKKTVAKWTKSKKSQLNILPSKRTLDMRREEDPNLNDASSESEKEANDPMEIDEDVNRRNDDSDLESLGHYDPKEQQAASSKKRLIQ
jgi:hypothetical protein